MQLSNHGESKSKGVDTLSLFASCFARSPRLPSTPFTCVPFMIYHFEKPDTFLVSLQPCPNAIPVVPKAQDFPFIFYPHDGHMYIC